MRTSKLKTILSHSGIRELLDLHRADALASGHSPGHVDYCEYLLREWRATELNPPPLVTGHDLTRRGLTPGPKYKVLLDAVREAQLDGTVRNSQQALELVDQLILQNGESGQELTNESSP
jgi:poly(A) polymerase